MPQLNMTQDLDLDFDAVSDGYVRMGPIRRHCSEAIMRKMGDHGVFAYTDEAEVLTERDANGDLIIIAIAEDVTGYFTDEDQHEAATSDTDAFLLSCLTDGETISVEGSYPNGMGDIVQTSSRFMRQGGIIYRDIERMVQRPCGAVTEVMNICEVRELELSLLSANSGGNVLCFEAFRKRKVA